MCEEMFLLATNTSLSFTLWELRWPEKWCHWPINLSWRWVSFISKLPSNSMSGLLPPALVCPLTNAAVWPVIYVYGHLVGPGCHGQQDGNPLINTPLRCFHFAARLYSNKDNKTVWLSVSVPWFISLNNNTLLTQEDDYYNDLIGAVY